MQNCKTWDHFNFFFTLSAADSRWDKNFSSILASRGIKVEYEFDNTGKEQTLIILENGEKMKPRCYLREKIDKSLHELIQKN